MASHGGCDPHGVGRGQREHAHHYGLTVENCAAPGVKPLASLNKLAQRDLWESNEEYEAFLADLYASRRAGFA